ncbi:CorA metal ion transporter [Entomortierella lignicola]|nr:CorA metal ion transporter [Entomortierella lignicola]
MLRSERLPATHQHSMTNTSTTRSDPHFHNANYRGNGMDGVYPTSQTYQHHRHHYNIFENQLGNNIINIDYEGLDAAIEEASLEEGRIQDQDPLLGEDNNSDRNQKAEQSNFRQTLGSGSVFGSTLKRRSSRKASYYGERSPRASIQGAGDSKGPKVFSDLLKDGCFWIDILDPSEFDMQILSKHFHIHPLTVEDISTEEIREKYEVFRNYYFVCFRTFDNDYNSNSYLQPVSMYSVVLKEGIITFHFRPTHHHLNVLRRLEQYHSHITLSPDWINYALLDDITDSFASPIQTIEYEVDSIDELVLLLRENETSDMLRRIGSCRKNVMMISRLLTNKADVVRGLMKRFDERYTTGMSHVGPGPSITTTTQNGGIQPPNEKPPVVTSQQQALHLLREGEILLYLGDILDHILTMLQSLYSYEKILSRSHSNYLAQISLEINQASNKTNSVVGTLTFFASLIVPMTFVAGLWGTTHSTLNLFIMSMAINVDRKRWEESIALLIHKAQSHEEVYSVNINKFLVYIHPNVYSPKYFPESSWYAKNLQQIVNGRPFLEVGVGSGIISLHVAKTGSNVYGVDINPDAIEITRKNFEANGLKADVRLSDLYSNLDPETRVDFIFWNHPWQYSSTIVAELKSEKTFDEGYSALTRYIAEGHRYLNDGGAILIGTSCYANLEAVNSIASRHGYNVLTEVQGIEKLEDGTEEVYYILRLNQV